jgi:multiple RNA-binding domain-containing protein 1
MNISKADILNPDGSANAAVKLALAETHVITETKSYLSSQGIDLDAFGNEQRRPRSDTVILVKNIPYGTSAEQIREMFVTHGELTRVLVPPAGTMAIVEFKHPGEASAAFRAVAYRRLGNSVIYLEKAPVGLFKSAPLNKPDTLAASIIVGGPKPVHVPETAKTGDTTNGGEESLPLSAGSTLFIKNLSFATTSERLSAVFQHLPSFAFARVQTKPDPHQPGGTLSAGYGFVGFRDVGAAQSALKGMHGFILDGHALAVSFAGRGADDGEGKKTEAARKGTTKMIVKNVPFEATKKDLRELFGCVGLRILFSQC